jgi:hypothetical protein
MEYNHDTHWVDIHCSVCGCVPSDDGLMNRPLQCVGCKGIFCTRCFKIHAGIDLGTTEGKIKDGLYFAHLRMHTVSENTCQMAHTLEPKNTSNGSHVLYEKSPAWLALMS